MLAIRSHSSTRSFSSRDTKSCRLRWRGVCGRFRRSGPSLKSRSRRRGVTLLEVVLALGIFMGAVAALNQLNANGVRSALQSRLQTQAILRCESKMAEVAATIEPLVDAGETSFGDDSDWVWSLAIADGPHADTLSVTVNVAYQGKTNLASSSYSLTRLFRDPLVFQAGDAAGEEGTTE